LWAQARGRSSWDVGPVSTTTEHSAARWRLAFWWLYKRGGDAAGAAENAWRSWWRILFFAFSSRLSLPLLLFFSITFFSYVLFFSPFYHEHHILRNGWRRPQKFWRRAVWCRT